MDPVQEKPNFQPFRFASQGMKIFATASKTAMVPDGILKQGSLLAVALNT